MATRSLKRSALWRIDFKKKGDFRQKIWAVSPFGNFSPKKKGCTRVLEVNLTNFWTLSFPITQNSMHPEDLFFLKNVVIICFLLCQ